MSASLETIEGLCREILAGMQRPKAAPSPTVRKDPPRWYGQSYVGEAYSNCPPDFLDMLADFLDWVAGKKDEEGKANYAAEDRANATAARSWAKKHREAY